MTERDVMTAGGFRSFNATSPQRRHQLPKLEINATSDQRCVSVHLPTFYKNSANAIPACFGVEVVGCLGGWLLRQGLTLWVARHSSQCSAGGQVVKGVLLALPLCARIEVLATPRHGRFLSRGDWKCWLARYVILLDDYD